MKAETIVKKLIELEEKHRLLSGDQIEQEGLYEIQTELCDIIIALANRSKGRAHDRMLALLDRTPYLFYEQDDGESQ